MLFRSEFARERGLLVTAQGTGHNAGAYDTLANTTVIASSAVRYPRANFRARYHADGG